MGDQRHPLVLEDPAVAVNDSVDRPTRPARREADPAAYPGAPRWVKVLAISGLVVVLLVLLLHLSGVVGGEHGPGRHLRTAVEGGGGRYAGHLPLPPYRFARHLLEPSLHSGIATPSC
jgi:hypothetical protein